MGLVSQLLQHAPPAARSRFSQLPDLEEALSALLQQGVQRFPRVTLSPERFMAFLAQRLRIESVGESGMTRLHGHELYLVCAYGLGDRAAHEIVESEYLARVRKSLFRLRATAEGIDEVLQKLRHLLLEMNDAASTQPGYSGRGELEGWLRIVAVREIRHGLRREQRLLSLDESAVEILGPSSVPETALARQLYGQHFKESFREAVSTLSSRERNLLRYHFVFRLSIDRIAQIYGIHRATAARWVKGAQEHLSEATREAFRRRIDMGDDSANSLMELLQSQLSLSIADWLHRETEPEEAA